MWFGRPWRLVEIELRDQVAQLGAQLVSDSLEFADELTGSSGKIRQLVRPEDKKRDNPDDQPMQRRERTIERHVPSLRPFDPTDCRTRIQTEASIPLPFVNERRGPPIVAAVPS